MTPPTVNHETSVAEARQLPTDRSGSQRQRALKEARPMLWLTGVEGGARVLSFGFYLIAARVLDPHGFGVVQYTITVAMLSFGGVQVLTTALIRELGATRGDVKETNAVLGSALAAAAGAWLVTSLLCVAAMAAGLAEGASLMGWIAVLAGTAVFQLYYAISRGLGHPGRQAASYAGASLAQLLAFAALAMIGNPDPTAALVIFGASSFVPVAIYEWRAPVLRGHALTVRRGTVKHILRLALPLLAAQICYLVWNSADQIWVQAVRGTFNVGLYASAKNLSLVMIVVPSGICGVLLPRVAELKTAGDVRGARRLIFWGAIACLAVSTMLAACIALLGHPMLVTLYGHPYGAASAALAVLVFGMVAFGVYEVVTIAAVGWGRPHVYTGSVALAATLELLILTLTDTHGLAAAAAAYAGSIMLALVMVLLLLRVRPLRESD